MKKYILLSFWSGLMGLVIGTLVLGKAIAQQHTEQSEIESFSDITSTESIGGQNDTFGEDLMAEPLHLLDYDWEAKPKFLSYTTAEQETDVFYQKYYQSLEYAYDQNGDLYALEMVHRVIQVNHLKAINQHNKLFIPLPLGSSLVTLKSRCIHPDQSVVEMEEEQLRTVMESGLMSSSIRVPIKGVEAGSQIEYFYVLKHYNPSSSGYHIFPQGVKVKNVVFEITSPTNLLFDLKSYNGLPEPRLQNDARGRNLLKMKADEISFLSHHTPARLHYRLSHHLNEPHIPLTSWGDISNQIVSNVYLERNTKENHKIQSILEQIQADKSWMINPSTKVQRIERFLKENIRLETENNYQPYALTSVLDNQITDEAGMLRLFCAFLEEAGINHRVVGTSHRAFFDFDDQFPSWDYIHTFLIYFPESKKYLAPANLTYRYGYIPYSLIGNKGIFVQAVSNTQGLFDMRTIKSRLSPSQTHTQYKVSFDKGLSQTKIALRRDLTGYSAIDYHQDFIQADDPSQTLAQRFDIRATASSIAEPVTITSIRNNYDESNLVSVDSFSVDGEIFSQTLVEQADQTYLFRVGSLLDAHPKFDAKRQATDLYPQKIQTSIEIKIPEGYYIRNLKELNKQAWSAEGSQMKMYFRAEYTVKNYVLYITVTELYKDNVESAEEKRALERINATSVAYSNATLVFQKMK